MSYQHYFAVEDVTCEKCDARIRNALLTLPGALHVELVRTPQNIADVLLTTTEALSLEQIETVITQQSVGTTHNYRVRWSPKKG
ncbi:MAG: heavy-metal-associated domain-containing protein [Chloroflexi bacterium]|nr:MAG: heavy-metal-associated domain-containing protein [Chloroflexota bacterium]